MRFPFLTPSPSTSAERLRARVQAQSMVRQGGTQKPVPPPRDLIAQSSARGVLVSWGLPEFDQTQVAGWRVYKDDDQTMFTAIQDRANRQCMVPASAGTVVNVFVSSVNALGIESNRVQVQGTATAEAGAPSIAGAPPGFSDGSGSDTSGGLGVRTINNQGFPQT